MRDVSDGIALALLKGAASGVEFKVAVSVTSGRIGSASFLREKKGRRNLRGWPSMSNRLLTRCESSSFPCLVAPECGSSEPCVRA